MHSWVDSGCSYSVHKFKPSHQKSFTLRRKTITKHGKSWNFSGLEFVYIVTALYFSRNLPFKSHRCMNFSKLVQVKFVLGETVQVFFVWFFRQVIQVWDITFNEVQQKLTVPNRTAVENFYLFCLHCCWCMWPDFSPFSFA